MKNLGSMKNKISKHLFSALPIAVSVVALLLPGAANAACGPELGSKVGVMAKMPALPQLEGKLQQPSRNHPIVGLWHVIYTSGGELFLETLDLWHNDGTEFEGANAVPTEGNVCFGVWKKTGARSVQLFHIGWNFDPSGNPIGTFTLQENNTVAKGGATYTGTFDFKIYDVNGDMTFEATGTQDATRITVN